MFCIQTKTIAKLQLNLQSKNVLFEKCTEGRTINNKKKKRKECILMFDCIDSKRSKRCYFDSIKFINDRLSVVCSTFINTTSKLM